MEKYKVMSIVPGEIERFNKLGCSRMCNIFIEKEQCSITEELGEKSISLMEGEQVPKSNA